MRIFFGATIPESIKAQIMEIQEELRRSSQDARFESKDRLHITLQFIGDFKPEESSDLFSSVAKETEKSSFRFSRVQITGINFFPNEKIRRGIWLDCKDDGTLGEIADAIKSVTRQFGIVPEARSFKAHITLARLKGEKGAIRSPQRDAIGDLKKFESEGKLRVEEFFPMSIALFESVLKPSGSEYKILSQVPLLPRQD